MASLAKKYTKQKLLGQVYTPNYVVCKMLDDLGFNNDNIIGKTILDPSCGDGRFLTEIVERIIQYSSDVDIVKNLQNVYGWDIDSNAVEYCLSNLNEIIKPLNITVEWNVFCVDSIRKYEKHSLFSIDIENQCFDFIVGNPPYIRIQHIGNEQRQYIQDNYSFCQSGSTDIYIAFYELCINLLAGDGICGLITPNTYFYTETAKLLRGYFSNSRNLLQISNYSDIQLFNDATTYSAITIFDKKKHDGFTYQKAISEKYFESRFIKFEELREPFWQLSTEEQIINKGRKLGDIAGIHVGITTLCDKAYIFSIIEMNASYVIAETRLMGNVKLEKDILRPIVKCSTLKNERQEIREYVLFPYVKVNGKHRIISEENLKNKYPLAYKYLLSVKRELDKRDNGKPNPVALYAFGRSQGLDTSFGDKIVFSPMNAKPNFIYLEDGSCTFYSGYCIKYQGNKKQLLSQLNSDRMRQFIEMSSRDFRGGWKAYNKKVVENYIIE